MNIKYASVVVSYNRKKLLKEAVESLLAQEVNPSYILIVDNASTDGTEQMIADHFANNDIIKYFRLEKNMGGAYGFWYGIKEATKLNVDWISVSDDDAIYSSSYFNEISNGIKRNPNTLAFTGTVKLTNGDIQKSHRRKVANWRTLKQYEVDVDTYRNNFNFDVFTFVGAVLNKKLIKKIGLPKKDFFIWYDDTEYSLRVRKHTNILNISNALILHKTKIPAQSEQSNPTDWKQYYGIRNQLITVKIHAQSPVLAVLYVVYRTVRRMSGTLIKSERKGYRKYMLRQDLKGLIDGLLSKSGANREYMPK